VRIVSHTILIALSVLLSLQAVAQKKRKKDAGLSYDDQRRVTEMFFEANRQKMLGNIEDAALLYRDILKIDAKNAASFYEISNIMTAAEQLQEALPFAQRAYELDAKNEWYALFLAEIMRGLNDLNGALKIYKKLAEDHPSKIEYQYEMATTYLYIGKADEAIAAYNKIEEVIGVSEEISVQKEKIYLQLDKLPEAAKELENLINNYPGEQRYLGMLAEVYTANDMLDKAFEVYGRMLKNDPDDPILHLNLAEYYRKRGEYDRSFEELKVAFKSSSLNIDNKIQVMMSYYNLTESENKLLAQAYELLDLMTAAHPKEAKAFAMKADFLLRDGKTEEARQAFYTTVTLDSSRFPIWNQLVNTSYQLGDYAAMEKDSKAALELFPNQGMLYLLNGIAHNGLKNYKAAISILTEGETFARTDSYMYAQLLSVLADVYNSTKNYTESDAAFEKALAREPTNALLLNNYAYFLSLRKDRLDKAEEMSRRSNVLAPRQSSYQDTYAWILFQQGKFEEAKEWIQKAFDNGGQKSGVIVEHYGDILYRLGQTDEALNLWKRARELGDHSDELPAKIESRKLP